MISPEDKKKMSFLCRLLLTLYNRHLYQCKISLLIINKVELLLYLVEYARKIGVGYSL